MQVANTTDGCNKQLPLEFHDSNDEKMPADTAYDHLDTSFRRAAVPIKFDLNPTTGKMDVSLWKWQGTILKREFLFDDPNGSPTVQKNDR